MYILQFSLQCSMQYSLFVQILLFHKEVIVYMHTVLKDKWARKLSIVEETIY